MASDILNIYTQLVRKWSLSVSHMIAKGLHYQIALLVPMSGSGCHDCCASINFVQLLQNQNPFINEALFAIMPELSDFSLPLTIFLFRGHFCDFILSAIQNPEFARIIQEMCTVLGIPNLQ